MITPLLFQYELVMKSIFKTLSFIFFISLMLLACPLYSWAEEEVSEQTKDIQKSMVEDGVSKYIEHDRYGNNIFKIHFDKDEDARKRTIKAELITNALNKKYSVEKIDIKNAIITGDLDFHIQDNLVNIDESGMEVDELNELQDLGMEKFYLVSSSINIESCQIQGNLEAGYDEKLKSFVIFKKSVGFSSSTVEKANFRFASFKENAYFESACFTDWAYFREVSFNGEVNFESASFYDETYFKDASFNGEAYFGSISFNSDADFRFASFKKRASFNSASFKQKADFMNASFNGEVNFESASFYAATDFRNAIFNDKPNFVSAYFYGGQTP